MPSKKKRHSTESAAEALEAARELVDDLKGSDEPWNDPSLRKETPKYDPAKDRRPPPKEAEPTPSEDAFDRADNFRRRNRKIERLTRPIRPDK